MLHAVKDPLLHFADWFNQANNANIPEYNAMSLATVNAANKPSLRIVLLKHYDEQGLVFFTNYESRKGKELKQNANVALLFWWSVLDRQIRIEGNVEKLTATQSDVYFQQRPRLSQINAWASEQSQVIANRDYLLTRQQHFANQFADQLIPRPNNWGGYRVKPNLFEFWQGDPFRLHDRLVYLLNDNNEWEIQYLAP